MTDVPPSDTEGSHLWVCDVKRVACRGGTEPWCEGCPHQAKPENRAALREGSNPKGECPPGPSAEHEEPGHEVTRPKESGE